MMPSLGDGGCRTVGGGGGLLEGLPADDPPPLGAAKMPIEKSTEGEAEAPGFLGPLGGTLGGVVEAIPLMFVG